MPARTRPRPTGWSRQLRERLQAAREAKGWSQQKVADEIARELGKTTFSRKSVNSYEKFVNQPPIDVMAAWARAVGLRLQVDLIDSAVERQTIAVLPVVAPMAVELERLSDSDRDLVRRLVAALPGADERARRRIAGDVEQLEDEVRSLNPAEKRVKRA